MPAQGILDAGGAPPIGLQPYVPQPGEAGVTNPAYPFGDPMRYGADKTGVADSRAAFLAAQTAVGASGQIKVGTPGTYRFAANTTIASPMYVAPGVLLSRDNNVTLTINGKFECWAYRTFNITAAGQVSFGVGSIPFALLEWFYDGGGDYAAALVAAAKSTPSPSAGGSGIGILLLNQRYRFLSAVTLPNDGFATKPLCIEGISGAGADQLPTLSFAVAAVGGLDCSPFGDQVTLRRMRISHDDVPGGHPANEQAGYGVGLQLATGSYAVLEDVWIEYFNVGMDCTDMALYADWNRVRCQYNYTAGLRGRTGALLNASTIRQSSFSNTRAGSGIKMTSVAATGVCWIQAAFEANAVSGVSWSAEGPITLHIDAYCEANGDIDIDLENDFAGPESVVHISGYFDPAGAVPHARIRHRDVRLHLDECRLYTTGGFAGPPVKTAGVHGTQPSIAMNCVYETAEISDVGAIGWMMVDSKHGYDATSAGVTPAGITSAKPGQFFRNTDEATLATIAGWLCTVGGASAGVVPSPAVTAATTNGSPIVTLSDVSHQVISGDYIQIAGVTFGGATSTYARVLSLPSNSQVKLDRNADNTVAAGAVSYRPATFISVPSRPVGNTSGTIQGNTGPTNAGAAATVIYTSAQYGGLDTGNRALVYGYDIATGTKLFTDEVVWMTNGTATVLGSSVKNAPEARTYSVVGTTLKLAMAVNIYVIKVVNLMSGYDA